LELDSRPSWRSDAVMSVSRSPVPALDRGLRILAELADRPDGLRFTDLLERFGLSKPVLSRLLQVLIAHGYVVKTARDGRYYLDQHVPVRGIRQQLEDCDAAMVLPDLAADVQGTALVVVRDGAGMRTVAKQNHAEGPLMRPVGSIRYTFFTHPWSWCVLLDLPEAEYQRLLRAERPDEALLAQVAQARRDLCEQGWCWQQHGAAVQRLGAPIRDRRQRVVAALAVGLHQADDDRCQRIGRLLVTIAADLSRRLGFE
jgi:DNA-binding IclR family transcriptional regulator